MKKIINNPADVVPEMVNGMVRLYPQYIEKIDGTEVMVRSDKESMQGKVGIVSHAGRWKQKGPSYQRQKTKACRPLFPEPVEEHPGF